MTIVITGASGHLGGGIVDELLRLETSRDRIVPVIRSQVKAESFAHRGLSPRIASYEDFGALRNAFEAAGTVVLISSPELTNALRVQQLHNAVMAAHSVGVEHLIYIGLAAPEKQAFGLEDVELATEYLIRALGVPFTFVRNGAYFDELRNELEIAARTGVLLSATGNQPLNWAPRQDMASAVATMIHQNGHKWKTYELTAAETFTYDDLATALSKTTGRPVAHRQTDPDSVVRALIEGGIELERASAIVKNFQGAIAKRKFTDHSETLVNFTGRSTDPATSVRRLCG